MPTDPNPATPDQQIDTFRTLERWLVCADGTTIEERAEAFAAAVRAVVTASKPEREVPSVARDEKARANVPDLNHANRHGTELKAAPPPPASPTPPVVPPVGPDECVVIDRDTAAAFMAGWDKQWEEAKRMRGGTWVLPWAEPMVNQLRDRLAARVTPSQEGRG